MIMTSSTPRLTGVLGLALALLAPAVHAQDGPPAKPTIQIQNWNHVGDFPIVWNKWYGTSATSWELYEDGVKVQSGSVAPNGTGPQSVTMQVTGKQLGVYTYQVKLLDAAGGTWSDPSYTTVGNASLIGITQWDTGSQALQHTMAVGSATVDLTLAGGTSTTYTVASNNPKVATATVSGTKLTVKALAAGRAGVRIVDAAGDGRWIGIRVSNADGSLPGLPKYVALGSVGDDTTTALATFQQFGAGELNTRADMRYIYLNGGASVPGNSNWCTWTTVPCFRETSYIRESKKLGMTPVFVFYNIPDGGESYTTDLAHIQDPAYMSAYFKDWANVISIANTEAGDDLVGYVIEPDFIGYLMQNSGLQPSQIAARVDQAYASGVLNTAKGDPQFPNTVAGLVNAVNYIIQTRSKNAWYGWQINLWADPNSGASGQGLMHITDPDEKGWTAGRPMIAASAQRVANYYGAAGITSYGAGMISFDKYGYDGGAPGNSKWLFNADHWNNYLYYVQTLHASLKKPVALWQLPVGHVNGTTGTNPYTNAAWARLDDQTSRHYEDSAPTYFLGDTFTAANSVFPASYYQTNVAGDTKVTVSGSKITWGSHLKEAKASGVVALMFGAGVGDSTDDVGLGGMPLTDDHWWLVKANDYLQGKTVALKSAAR
ncbi:MAG TPA: chitinase N-terminal domain-containing protein [Burkholderiaceae bacterium]